MHLIPSAQEYTGVRLEAEQAGHHITATASKWTTLEGLIDWFEKIIYPDYLKMCQKWKRDPGVQLLILQVGLKHHALFHDYFLS